MMARMKILKHWASNPRILTSRDQSDQSRLIPAQAETKEVSIMAKKTS